MGWIERSLELNDILLTLDVMEGYMHGHTVETFCLDQSAVKAVIFNLRMIHGSASRIPPEIRLRYPRVPWALFGGLVEIKDPRLIFVLVRRRLLPAGIWIARDLERARRAKIKGPIARALMSRHENTKRQNQDRLTETPPQEE